MNLGRIKHMRALLLTNCKVRNDKFVTMIEYLSFCFHRFAVFPYLCGVQRS